MKILVTGAAGYVGSVAAEALINAGHEIIVLDDLSKGHREAVPEKAVFFEGNFGNGNLLADIFHRYNIDAVMHFAAFSLVGESVTVPSKYYHNNVVNTLNLLDKIVEHKISRVVFSSSAAVYGYPEKLPIIEDTVKTPINPYGETKLTIERMLYWYAQAYKIDSVSLRYFNAAGATKRYGEDHNPETHLIPILLRAAGGKSKGFSIFGKDYPTSDGTCIRDYVHVSDIASAHVLALDYLQNNPGCHAFNLGTGQGFSVLEIFNAAKEVTGRNIPLDYQPRRPGDPPVLVADPALAKEQLGWTPLFTSVKDIISSAWEWQKQHPDGYFTR